MRLIRIVVCGALASCLSAPQAFALDPRTPPDRYARQTWSTENGLPQDSVHALLQTSDGFLWLGTEAGLARFDGYQFKVFDRNSTPALPTDDIRCLLADKTGGLWMGTASGLILFRDGRTHTFTVTEGLPAGAVKSIIQSGNGDLWVLTANGLAFASARMNQQAFTFAPELVGESVTAVATDGGDGLWAATTQGLRHLSQGKSDLTLFSGINIQALTNVSGDIATLAVASSMGAFRIRDGVATSVAGPESLPAEGTRSLLATSQGLWALGRTSVTFFSTRSSVIFKAGVELPGSQVATLLEDRHGAVWIGTNGGVVRYLDGRLESVGDARDAVLSLFEDRDGDLWEGTETQGVRVLRDRIFQLLDPSAQTSDASPTSVAQTGDKSIWIGTNGSGVFPAQSQHKKMGHSTEAGGATGDTVLALASGGASAQDLWIGTPNGLKRLHDGRWSHLTSADGLADDLVRSLLPVRDGILLIGTPHGLTRLRDGRISTMSNSEGLGSNLIGPMVQTADGDVWVGTFGGLSRLHDGTFRNFTTADGLPGNTVTALAPAANGGLWVGTKGQGLSLWDGKAFARFAARAIPLNVYSLVDDMSGSLWLTSEHGIFRVSIQILGKLAREPTVEIPVISYGTADGLSSIDTAAIGYPSALRLDDGRICFVTRRGVVVTDPTHALRSDTPPPVALEDVLIDDRIVAPDELASIAPGPLHFAFTFAGINLSVPQRVEYRYALDGLDQEWVYAGTRRTAYYTNIPHGRYRFRVSARNQAGAWSAPAELRFELRPHFYQTLLFRALLVLVVLMIGLGLYATRVRAIRNRFSLVSAERSRLAREIHDTLAQSFVAVSMRLEVMSQMLKSGDGIERCREQLNQTRTLVRESLEEARRSIWDLRSEGADAQALPARLACVVQSAAATVKGSRIETTGIFRPLERQLEDELFRIAQEAVANAVRHAAAQSIRVRLSYEFASLRLEVTDDGCGFESGAVPSNGAGHYGLTGIRERGSLIGAEIMLKSVLGEGTTICVVVPLDRETPAGKG